MDTLDLGSPGAVEVRMNPGELDQGLSPLPVPPGLSHPFSIDVFEDYIYGVTYINNRVFKIHKFGHSPLINLTGGLSHASDVVLYHQHKQPEGGQRRGPGRGRGGLGSWRAGKVPGPQGSASSRRPTPTVTNPCDRKKCEWLCLLSPSGPVCTCPNGKRLDNGTCVAVPSPTPPPDGMLTPLPWPPSRPGTLLPAALNPPLPGSAPTARPPHSPSARNLQPAVLQRRQLLPERAEAAQVPLPAPLHGRQVRAGPVLGALSERGHLRCLPLRYALWFSPGGSSSPWAQPHPHPTGPALPCFTSASPRTSPHSPGSLPSLCCLPPTRDLKAPLLCSKGGWFSGSRAAHTSSPTRHAHVPLPHGLHGPQVHPAGVCGLLCQQQHLHCQPGQPAPVPMPAWLPG